VAEGKLAAQCIDAWLRGTTMPDRAHSFESRLSRLSTGELCDFCAGCASTPRIDERVRADELTDDEARREAERCLECDCKAIDSCRLHRYAAMYRCDAHRFGNSSRHFEGRVTADGIVLEQGKCIVCGICVQLSGSAPDALGLAFLGRSMDIHVGPPDGVTLEQALGSAARRCADACPTGAIVFT
jgi:predicted molibdopterin-dependent oxidoreductase YjgC